jgi:predicted O-linked N-acetylglucosamine transferase (SPINDLY family)
LPRSYWCYQPKGSTPKSSGQLPFETAGYLTFGCLNNFAKVSPAALDLWRQILSRRPDSRLLLCAPAGSCREDVRSRFEKGGVGSERIEFVAMQSWEKYLDCIERVDIALDPFPYGGGITTLDALWMGVPVVTLSGRTAVGRGGRSILSNLGLPELIADTSEHYELIALSLIEQPEQLREWRNTLRTRMETSPLRDAKGFARDVESAYRGIWRDWCAGV